MIMSVGATGITLSLNNLQPPPPYTVHLDSKVLTLFYCPPKCIGLLYHIFRSVCINACRGLQYDSQKLEYLLTNDET